MSQIAHRFLAAVTALAGDASIKVRLASAYSECLAAVRIDQLPRELREDFESLQGAMQAVDPQPNESAIAASIRKMSGQEAMNHAHHIVTMFSVIMDSRNQAEIARDVAPGETDDTADYSDRSIRLQ